VLAVTFIAFFWICDTGFQRSIETTVNDSSQTNLQTVERVLASSAHKGKPAISQALADLASLWANGALLEVTDGSGEWLFRSDPFLDQSPRLPSDSDGGTKFFTTNLDANQYRVAMARVHVADNTYAIHAAVPTEPFDQALDRFRLIEKEALPLLVLIASMLGYWLSGKSLAPVDRIIRTAEQIGVDNLSRRLEVPEPRDELRRLTQTLNSMLDRIETSFQRITRFTADASHDLRTPVTIIRATAEIALRKRRSDLEYKEALTKVLETSIETSEMLENLLALARADAGAGGLEMHPVDLTAHIRKAQERAAALAASKSLSLTARVPEASVFVRADAMAIDRLLLILLDNAVKYTPPGGRCEIELERHENEARIAVRDSGIGIENSELELVFERFHRSDRARSRETPGAGLGLAIARWIANIHGGSIRAVSQIGTGSEFSVTLPALTNP
jgi:heavy metal sensor kinase